MNDQTDRDLDQRLATSFRRPGLPGAPAALLDALERVPDVSVSDASDGQGAAASGRSRSTGRTLGLLGLAAVLAVGGAVALTSGTRPPAPEPGRSIRPTTPTAPVAVSTYQVEWTRVTPSDPETLVRLVDIVRGRLEASGGSGATVRAVGANRLIVEMPADLDADALRRVIGKRGDIAFVPLGDIVLEPGDLVDLAVFPPLFGGEAIQDARVGEGQTGQRVLQLQLRPAQATAFATYTAAHVGTSVAIAIDGTVISAPRIESEISGGALEITKAGVEGGFEPLEARLLAALLRLGPYPVALTEIDYQPIGGDPSSDPLAGTFPLRRFPDPPFCNFMATPYRSFEIRIDPTEVESVVAITDRGARIPVLWGATFVGRIGPPPVVVDDRGVAIESGTRVTIPDRDWPSLGGHTVCAGSTSIAVWDEVAASPMPTPSPFELERAFGDVGCDTIVPPYVGFSLQIDPLADHPVVAVTETGLRLPVLWDDEFRGSAGPPPAVIDARGHEYQASTYVRVRDVPVTSLGDHFLCPAPDTVFIFNEPPPS